ncbi:hypothetical protein BZA70DRAFT_274658 [Myxozyma melibiosi]|uniref:SH3 domain-containing protein n=1 Tax=Myxozyma melibiosi TaxID=54550 RepID=A0ABR1F9S4_9ASCO
MSPHHSHGAHARPKLDLKKRSFAETFDGHDSHADFAMQRPAFAQIKKPVVRRQILTVYQTLTVTRATPAATSTATATAIGKAVSAQDAVESTLAASSATSSVAAALTTSSVAATTLVTLTKSISATSSSATASSTTADSNVLSSTGSTDTGSSSSAENSGSLTAGARAGIAIGVIAGAFIIFALAFFLVRRRRVAREAQEAAFVEKSVSLPSESAAPPALPAVAHVNTKAPRLSIRVSRPVSGLLPLSLLSGRATRTSTGAIGQDSRPLASDADSLRSSTGSFESFKKELATLSSSPSSASSYTSSVSSDSGSLSSTSSSPVMVVPAPADNAAAVAAAATAASPLPDIPADAASSTSNVHRATMDFVPSMHDELALKEGQLVRVLHEYDDGWALCVKLDRSAQGVCPRSCLSVRPLRPRPKRGVKSQQTQRQAVAQSPTPMPQTVAGRSRPMSGERLITLPAINTEAANTFPSSSAGKVERKPETPTIQVFAPDAEKPFEVA